MQAKVFGLVRLLFDVPVSNLPVMLGGATAFWVFTSTFESLKCLAQRHYTAVVGFEPWTSRSEVRRSTAEPPHPPASESDIKSNELKAYNINLDSIFLWIFILHEYDESYTCVCA